MSVKQFILMRQTHIFIRFRHTTAEIPFHGDDTVSQEEFEVFGKEVFVFLSKFFVNEFRKSG